MAYTWGDIELNVAKGSYTSPIAENAITEIPVLPAIGDTTPSSILQQGGRGRYRVTFDSFAFTKADCDAYLEDYLFGTERVFIGPDSETMSMMIEKISPIKRTMAGLYEFSITLVES